MTFRQKQFVLFFALLLSVAVIWGLIWLANFEPATEQEQLRILVGTGADAFRR